MSEPNPLTTKPFTLEELDALDIVCGDPHPHGACLSCEADMSIKPGDEPTPLCHDCAHEVIRDVPRLVSMARRSLALEKRVAELEQPPSLRCADCGTHLLVTPRDSEPDVSWYVERCPTCETGQAAKLHGAAQTLRRIADECESRIAKLEKR